MRRASSTASSGAALPPLFIAFSVAADDDSAPENTIFNPDCAIARHVASEYCIRVSMRPSAHHVMPSGAMRSANSATRSSLMKKSMSCICTESTW